MAHDSTRAPSRLASTSLEHIHLHGCTCTSVSRKGLFLTPLTEAAPSLPAAVAPTCSSSSSSSFLSGGCYSDQRSQMALRGVWQLQKLIVSYSDWGGSSRGIRAFMESNLPSFREKNPRLEVVTELIRGQHPHLKAFYRNKNERVICVKNMDPEDILLHATRLRNALGRKVVKLKTRHLTKHPSVQGTWTTEVKF